jgi:hypothetical protein
MAGVRGERENGGVEREREKLKSWVCLEEKKEEKRIRICI